MSQDTPTPPPPPGTGVAPRQTSLLRSSALMASGTMVSRVLGFVRTALLLAAIGTVGGGVSAAFQVANTLPNTVYNLLAAGVFDAVLVPQIVRALKRRSGDVYVNRLITLAGTILFGVTVVAMIGAPLLVLMTASRLDSEARMLAITFSLMCLPQIFFYGVYNLLGELLNARGIFGPYMWAPVVNNIVAIAGLAAFIGIWGSSPDRFAVSDFTDTQFWLLTTTTTAGVILQAAVLLVPMRRAGIRLRPDFHFRGTSFGSTSKVAGWTFATLGISQLGILSTTNLATQADGWAQANPGATIAGYASYTTAFMVYMVPQSLISVSLATAIFTRLANAAADRDHRSVAASYHTGVRLITMLSLLAAAILMAGAVPMLQLVMPGAGPDIVRQYGWVLIALMPGVASTGMVLMSQRVFFAYEDAKPVFLMGIVPTALQVLVGWSIFFLADAQWWTAGAALSETVCRLTQGFIAVIWVARKNRWVNPGMLIASYVKYFLAAAVAFVVALLVVRVMGPVTTLDRVLLRFLVAGLKLTVVAVVATAAYAGVLRIMDPVGSARVAAYLARRLPMPAAARRLLAGSGARRGRTDNNGGTTAEQAGGATMRQGDEDAHPEAAHADGPARAAAMGGHEADRTRPTGPEPAAAGDDAQGATAAEAIAPGTEVGAGSGAPTADERAQSEAASLTGWSMIGRSWAASDPTHTGEFPVVRPADAPGPHSQDPLLRVPTFDEVLHPSTGSGLGFPPAPGESFTSATAAGTSAPQGGAAEAGIGEEASGSAPWRGEAAASDGTGSDSTGSDSTGSDSTAPDGTGSHGTAPDGTAPDSTGSDSTGSHGTAPDSTAPDGTAPVGPAPVGAGSGASGSDGIAAGGGAPGSEDGLSGADWVDPSPLVDPEGISGAWTEPQDDEAATPDGATSDGALPGDDVSGDVSGEFDDEVPPEHAPEHAAGPDDGAAPALPATADPFATAAPDDLWPTPDDHASAVPPDTRDAVGPVWAAHGPHGMHPQGSPDSSDSSTDRDADVPAWLRKGAAGDVPPVFTWPGAASTAGLGTADAGTDSAAHRSADPAASRPAGPLGATAAGTAAASTAAAGAAATAAGADAAGASSAPVLGGAGAALGAAASSAGRTLSGWARRARSAVRGTTPSLSSHSQARSDPWAAPPEPPEPPAPVEHEACPEPAAPEPAAPGLDAPEPTAPEHLAEVPGWSEIVQHAEDHEIATWEAHEPRRTAWSARDAEEEAGPDVAVPPTAPDDGAPQPDLPEYPEYTAPTDDLAGSARRVDHDAESPSSTGSGLGGGGSTGGPRPPLVPSSPAPGGGGSGGSGRMHARVNPTVPAMIFAGLLVVVGMWWAIGVAFSPVKEVDEIAAQFPGEQSGQSGQSGESGAASPTPSESKSSEAPVVKPVLLTPTVFSWKDGGGDHPELAASMVDNDPSTAWRSLYYDSNVFTDADAITILLPLKAVSTVTTVQLTMDSGTTGGEMVVRSVDNPDQPRQGTELTSTALSPTTTITLPKPVKTQYLALEFRSLPTDSEGVYRAWISEVTVK